MNYLYNLQEFPGYYTQGSCVYKFINFIKKNKQYKASDRPWEKYFL